jgi:hypothetical protein
MIALTNIDSGQAGVNLDIVLEYGLEQNTCGGDPSSAARHQAGAALETPDFSSQHLRICAE